MISRRHWLTALAAPVLLPALPGCSFVADKPIAIAAHTWMGYEPLFLAAREGWLDTSKATLVETLSASGSIQAIKEGRAHGAALTLDEMLRAREDGIPLSIVMVFDISAGADMLLTVPHIASLTELQGQRIGVEKSSVGELLLSEVLTLAGLTQRDVTVVPLRIDQHRNAWENQQVDALITYEPVAGQLLTLGARKLFDSRQIPNAVVDVLAMRTDSLGSEHHQALKHAVGAHFKALRHLHRNPQDAAYRMAPHLAIPASQVLAAYKGLLLPDAANNHRLLSGENPALYLSAQKLARVMLAGDMLRRKADLTDIIRADFLPLDV